MKLYYLQCKEFQFVVVGKVRWTVFIGCCRNIFSGNDSSAPLQKNWPVCPWPHRRKPPGAWQTEQDPKLSLSWVPDVTA